MRVDLLQLLLDREVQHPSRIVQAVLGKNRDLRVRLSGFPWWDDRLDKSRDYEIELVFGEVEGIIRVEEFDPDYDEALECFGIVETSGISWVQRDVSSIYCQAPLPAPLEIHRIVHDFLASHGSFVSADRYLNCPQETGLLADFVQLTQSSVYQLGSFPPAMRDLVCEELQAQGVPYSELRQPQGRSRRLLVTLQASQFFCETAEAVIEF